jgi:riboflavin-specific deaminase-like protein
MVVTVHVAQSLDGRLAIEGRATPLSSQEGQRSAHLARAAHDAVLVGINTVRIDDPQLTVRHVEGRDPLRVVLASRLDLPPSAKVLGSDGRLLVIGARGKANGHLNGCTTCDFEIVDSTSDGMVDLRLALEVIKKRGVKKLLVEGGARVLSSFFRAHLVDEVEIEVAMKFLGAPGTPTLGALGVDGIDQAIELTDVSVDRLGQNVLLRGKVKRR